jgi:ATP-dependent Lon protease
VPVDQISRGSHEYQTCVVVLLPVPWFPRVVEYLAVLRLRGTSARAPILCFIGPPGRLVTSISGPSIAVQASLKLHSALGVCLMLALIWHGAGVGKTSLARSVAEVLGRPFVR